jgi:TetR/AcrR family transcriptional regulator, transcriptional repressor for nem operon
MNKAERTRQFIIEKTAPIFNKKGYAGTSLSDITDATGLTKGSIYGNFNDKDEVAVAAFEHNIGQLRIVLNAEMAKQTTARGKLLALIDAYQSIHKAPVEGGCPIMNTVVDADDTHSLLKAKVEEVVLKWKTWVTQVIEVGVSDGEFRAVENAEQAALTLFAIIEGAILIRRATNKPNYYRLVLDSARKMVSGM